MYEQVEKPKENKNRAVANSVAQKKNDARQGVGFVDNRPIRNEVIQKMKVASSGVMQLKLPADSKLRQLTWQGFSAIFKPGREHINKFQQWLDIFNHIKSDDFIGESEADVGRYIDDNYPGAQSETRALVAVDASARFKAAAEQVITSAASSSMTVSTHAIAAPGVAKEQGPAASSIRAGGMRSLAGKDPRPVREVDAVATPNSARSLIINYVWLGNGPLGPLEKFNINSWRALGHQVNIYTLRFDGEPSATANLGITADEAHIVNLSDKLSADKGAVDGGERDTPRAVAGDARDLLASWISAIPRGSAPTREHIYNMVDMAKSYVGATQRGIVLDLKVGPSEHLQSYAGSFDNRFISYSRAGKTGAAVENQSMGTMQESDDIRRVYATSFNDNAKMNAAIANQPGSSWFNLITSWHGRAYQKPKVKGLDVAKQSPAGDLHDGRDYKVSEPIESGHGPFRVFKAAAEQTNQGGTPLTTPQHVFDLAKGVFESQLLPVAANEAAAPFVAKAETALKELHDLASKK